MPYDAYRSPFRKTRKMIARVIILHDRYQSRQKGGLPQDVLLFILYSLANALCPMETSRPGSTNLNVSSLGIGGGTFGREIDAKAS